jgi:uncharacterized protein YjiK
MPTSIAVNPITNNIHIVSAENNMMLIVNAKGEIQEMVKFKKDQHYKVEGICFDGDGTMYLSNEAKDGKPAKLFAYKMQSGAAVTARR